MTKDTGTTSEYRTGAYYAEQKAGIVRVMIDMYCKKNHRSDIKSCKECRELFEYARSKTYACRQEPGMFCSACPTPCYDQVMRERMRTVMRYSGPRMLYRHPILYFRRLKLRLLRKK